MNPETGEVTVVLGGTTYRLVMKTAGLIALQNHFSRHGRVAEIDDIFQRIAAGSLEHNVAALWASMIRHHPEMTYEKCLDLIDSVGGLAGLTQALGLFSSSVTPDPEDVEELGAKAPRGNPRKARVRAVDGTGVDSTSPPAPPA